MDWAAVRTIMMGVTGALVCASLFATGLYVGGLGEPTASPAPLARDDPPASPLEDDAPLLDPGDLASTLTDLVPSDPAPPSKRLPPTIPRAPTPPTPPSGGSGSQGGGGTGANSTGEDDEAGAGGGEEDEELPLELPDDDVPLDADDDLPTDTIVDMPNAAPVDDEAVPLEPVIGQAPASPPPVSAPVVSVPAPAPSLKPSPVAGVAAALPSL